MAEVIGTGFKGRLKEWFPNPDDEYEDQPSVSWYVMEAGVWDMAGIPIEAGAVAVSPNNSDDDTSDFTSVEYNPVFAEACLTAAPVTLATILVPSYSMQDEEPLVVRMSRNTAADGFDLGL